MKLPDLYSGTILKRYKRFLCDVRLDKTNTIVTAHCPNTGSMRGISLDQTPVMLSHSNSTKRKYPYTLEMVCNNNVWIGINTMRTNKIAEEGMVSGKIKELSPFVSLKREVKCSNNSRLDFMLTQENQSCYVEVKNVTLVENNHALFPDSVTTRGQKHLKTLMDLKKHGARCIMLYIIQRSDCSFFRPAYEIDPEYSNLLKESFKNGIEVMAYKTDVSPEEIRINCNIPINCIS